MKILTSEQVAELSINESIKYAESLKNHFAQINVTIQDLAEKILAPLLSQYYIDEVGIDPNYVYDDEGFSGNNLITINSEDTYYNNSPVPKKIDSAPDISFSQLQREIDDKLHPLSGLLREDLSIDVSQLQIKYNHQALQEQTAEQQKTKPKSKSKSGTKI